VLLYSRRDTIQRRRRDANRISSWHFDLRLRPIAPKELLTCRIGCRRLTSVIRKLDISPMIFPQNKIADGVICHTAARQARSSGKRALSALTTVFASPIRCVTTAGVDVNVILGCQRGASMLYFAPSVSEDLLAAASLPNVGCTTTFPCLLESAGPLLLANEITCKNGKYNVFASSICVYLRKDGAVRLPFAPVIVAPYRASPRQRLNINGQRAPWSSRYCSFVAQYACPRQPRG
jgi:hypothetical protein